MLGWLGQLLGAPVFEGDEDKTRVARLLNAVIWAFMGVMLVYGISTLLLPNPREALTFVATVIAVSLIAFLLMRRGHVRPASIVFLSTAWLLLTLVALASGGIISFSRHRDAAIGLLGHGHRFTERHAAIRPALGLDTAVLAFQIENHVEIEVA